MFTITQFTVPSMQLEEGEKLENGHREIKVHNNKLGNYEGRIVSVDGKRHYY